MASVIGLAPIKPRWKDGVLELLCIHGLRLVPEVGIAPTSPPLQGGANLPQLLGGKFAFRRLVVRRGNAPRSSGYQPDALLLSYGTMAEGVGPRFARRTSVPWETNLWRNWEFKCSDLGVADPVFKTGAASLYLPAFRKMVRVTGVAPATSSFRTRPSAADITP